MGTGFNEDGLSSQEGLNSGARSEAAEGESANAD